MTVKLGKEIGGDCRELAGTANVFLSGIDALHDQYLAGMASNPGKLPVVELTDTIARESGQGAKKSTNYQPIFSCGSKASQCACCNSGSCCGSRRKNTPCDGIKGCSSAEGCGP
jgi:hypothetical protein